MAYSTLIMDPNTATYGVWCSNINEFIFQGNEDECYAHKHALEEAEQKEANKIALQKVYDARLQQLLDTGMYSEGEAKRLLRNHMPKLHEQLELA